MPSGPSEDKRRNGLVQEPRALAGGWHEACWGLLKRRSVDRFWGRSTVEGAWSRVGQWYCIESNPHSVTAAQCWAQKGRGVRLMCDVLFYWRVRVIIKLSLARLFTCKSDSTPDSSCMSRCRVAPVRNLSPGMISWIYQVTVSNSIHAHYTRSMGLKSAASGHGYPGHVRVDLESTACQNSASYKESKKSL